VKAAIPRHHLATRLMQTKAPNLNQLVSLFLAEALRTRRTSLPRAAEISHRVVTKLAALDSEEKALDLLTQIEKDFEEVSMLKQVMHFGHKLSDIRAYEREIKDYASKILENDITLSNAFLEAAARQGMTIEELCLKYPAFCSFLMTVPEKQEVAMALSHRTRV